MIVQTIITVAIIIILFIVFFKIFKTILKAISYTLLIVVIVSLVFGYFVFQDLKDIQQNFETEPKLFLLEDNNKIMAGVIITGNESVTLLTQKEQDKYTQYLKQNDLKSIKGNNYKLFILKKGFFNSSVQIEEDINLTKEQAAEIMTSEEAIKKYAQITNTNEAELANETTSAEVRSKIFTAALSSELNNAGGMLYIVQQIRKENAIVYEKTPVFMITDFAPNKLFAQAEK